MNETLKEKMVKAEMDAIMVVEAVEDWTAVVDELRAITRAQANGSVVAKAGANYKCEQWVEANPVTAESILDRRIRRIAARNAADARPLTAAEVEKMLGM